MRSSGKQVNIPAQHSPALHRRNLAVYHLMEYYHGRAAELATKDLCARAHSHFLQARDGLLEYVNGKVDVVQGLVLSKKRLAA